jgi:hypothetical protein
MIFAISPEERNVLYNYHSGQSSMLYAAASVGGVDRGTRRPAWGDHTLATDRQWDWILVSDLIYEVSYAFRLARQLEEEEDAATLEALQERLEAWFEAFGDPDD